MKEPKTIETIIIGIIARNMGYANQSKICAAGKEVLEFVSRLTKREYQTLTKINQQ